MDNDDPMIPGLDPRRQPQRVFKAQLIICMSLGLLSFLMFCVMRYRWPQLYAVRTLRRKTIKPLPRGLFSWISVLHNITDEEVLTNSGLDAFVYIGFFKMGIKIFGVCSLFALCIISPIRYYYTGKYDRDGIIWTKDEPVGDPDEDFAPYLWLYPMFTYLFTFLVYYFLIQQTKSVLETRQRYLGSQNSITDRTIRLDGVPADLQNAVELKNHIEELGIGRVTDVKLIYDWTQLETFFQERRKLIRSLEVAYSQYLGLKTDIYSEVGLVSVEPKKKFYTTANDLFTEPVESPEISESSPLLEDVDNLSDESAKLVDRPMKRLGLWGIFGPKVDKIKYYADRLKLLDGKIDELREQDNFKQVQSAFITMDSVASAQMAAQAVLDPRVHQLIAYLAPAPKDVKWTNFSMSSREKFVRGYVITIIIAITSVALVFPVSYLATFLNIKTITKFWPALGKLIGNSKWATTFVTGILPPYLFTMLNVCLPYFYSYLSDLQGYVSNGDIELATVGKNFFYIFVNLFLVFTLAGTFSNYWALLSDTTKLATNLANSLKNLSLFYVDLILLQGLGMFPLRLLQLGDVFFIGIGRLFYCQTPRDYRSVYYTPPVFNFGLQLPQPILILIITLIYSVMSTKIVTSGLVYFILGFYTYKYQLMYTYVHPPHSTGKVWPMIFRRVCLGLVLFELTMAGTLALEHAFLLAASIVPLMPITLVVAYNFEKDYLPLSFFIALRAIKKPEGEDLENSNKYSGYIGRNEFHDSGVSADSPNNSTPEPLSPLSDSMVSGGEEVVLPYRIRKRRSTIDEEREQFQSYIYPYLIEPLDGPWIGFEGDYVSMVNFSNVDGSIEEETEEEHDVSFVSDGEMTYNTISDGELIVRKRLRVAEWE